MSKRKFIFLLLFITLIWGLSYPINKQAFEYIDAFWLAAFRLIIGTTSILLFVLIKRKVAIPTRHDLFPVLGLSVFQISLFILMLTLGIYYADAGRAAILVYTTPLWLAPLTIILFKEKLSTPQLTGIGLGFLGIMLLFAPWELSWTDHTMIIGSIAAIFAAISLATGMLILRYHTWHTAPSKLILWQFILGTIFLVIIASSLSDFQHIQWNTHVILVLLYNGVLATAFNYWAFMEVGRHIHVVTLSLLLLITPVIGLISSVIWLDEPLTLTTIIATGLLLAGMVVITLQRKSN